MATTYIERRKTVRKRGLPSVYFYLTTQSGGRKRRRYIPLRNVLLVMRFLKSRKLNGARKESEGISISRKEDRHFISEPLRNILQSAGFNIHGSKLRICWQRYLTFRAARIRFSLLEKADKDFIRSPENLLAICRSAYGSLKLCNRMGISGKFDECLAECLIQFGGNGIVSKAVTINKSGNA